MKYAIHRFPFLSRIVFALLLGFAAIVTGGFVYKVVPLHDYFPFVGEALLIFATWVLYRTDANRPSPLGLNLQPKRMAYLLLGLAIGVAALLAVTWLRTRYTGEVWHLSSGVNGHALLRSLYYVLPSVIVQELMFRGYLFTKTVSRYGVTKANLIFATLFMLVHVLDRDVLQNPTQLIMLTVCIPIGHLWFATALLRSKTIWFPIGLHWGNNWATIHLMGLADNEQSIFFLTNQRVFASWLPFVIMLLIFNGFFLLVTWATWKTKWPLLQKKAV